MKNICILGVVFYTAITLFSETVTLYPNRIIPESFLIEKQNEYGVSKLYDGNPNTSFAFYGNSTNQQTITFYFDTPVSIDSFTIANGFQEKEELYYANARVKDVVLYCIDVNGNSVNKRYKIVDQKEYQTFPVILPNYMCLLKEVKLLVNLNDLYHGERYNDICISEVSFLGDRVTNSEENLKDIRLNAYFKTIKYNYPEGYTPFFEKELTYNFGRGGLISFANGVCTMKYLLPDLNAIENNGLRGRFEVHATEIVFFPDEILRSTGKGEEYTIGWEKLAGEEQIVFQLNKANVLYSCLLSNNIHYWKMY